MSDRKKDLADAETMGRTLAEDYRAFLKGWTSEEPPPPLGSAWALFQAVVASGDWYPSTSEVPEPHIMQEILWTVDRDNISTEGIPLPTNRRVGDRILIQREIP